MVDIVNPSNIGSPFTLGIYKTFATINQIPKCKANNHFKWRAFQISDPNPGKLSIQ